jgi:hypothetical protein
MSAKRTSAFIFGALIYSSLSDAKIAHYEMLDALFPVSENTALWRISFGFSHRTSPPGRPNRLAFFLLRAYLVDLRSVVINQTSMRHHSNSFCVRINWQHFAVNCREHTT